MNGFAAAIEFILGPDVEGEYSNDPDDPGKETHWGISQRAYPDLNIGLLTRAQAVAIYRRDYWDRVRCDEFPGQIALALFDSATNQGPGAAVRMLQQALRVTVDGIVGPETLQAAQRAIPGDVLLDFLSYRALRYAYGQPKYQRGWFRRLFLLQRAAWALA